MKKTKKLGLNKQTVRNLSITDAKAVAGAITGGLCGSQGNTCAPCNTEDAGTCSCTYFANCTFPTQGLC